MNMKRLISKLGTFFLAMIPAEDCGFKRGLRIRPKTGRFQA